MKAAFSFFTILLLSIALSAQVDEVKIELSKDYNLSINNYTIESGADSKEIYDLLGESSREVDYPAGESSLFYDELGIVFMTVDGAIKGMGVNLNWDGDTKFPETSLKGNLEINKMAITTETKSDDLLDIKGIKIICPVPILCASEDRSAAVNVMAGFKEEKISQVVFLMK